MKVSLFDEKEQHIEGIECNDAIADCGVLRYKDRYYVFSGLRYNNRPIPRFTETTLFVKE